MTEKNGNKWINNNALKIAVIIAGLIAAGAIIRDSVADMQPRLTQAEDDIVELEKVDIGIQGSIDALAVQQEVYHRGQEAHNKDHVEKLDAILIELRQ